MTDPEPAIWVEEWETVAVTALAPGWRNVFIDQDGGVFTAPCPALLLQEHRATVRELPNGDSKRQVRLPPYETQTVFAESEGGSLVAASDTANYIGTVPPGEDAASYALPASPPQPPTQDGAR